MTPPPPWTTPSVSVCITDHRLLPDDGSSALVYHGRRRVFCFSAHGKKTLNVLLLSSSVFRTRTRGRSHGEKQPWRMTMTTATTTTTALPGCSCRFSPSPRHCHCRKTPRFTFHSKPKTA